MSYNDIFSDEDAYETLIDIDETLMMRIEAMHEAGRPKKEILHHVERGGATALLLCLTNQALFYLDENPERLRAKRRKLKYRCFVIQEGICAVCGHGLHNRGDLHEAIIKRSDLPADNRIMQVYNCVVLHPERCHENTRAVDEACIAWLCHKHGAENIANWITSLGLVELPERARRVMELAKQARTVS